VKKLGIEIAVYKIVNSMSHTNKNNMYLDIIYGREVLKIQTQICPTKKDDWWS
jgi:hypothetical protein